MNVGDEIVVVKGPYRGRVGKVISIEYDWRHGCERFVEVILSGKSHHTFTSIKRSDVRQTKE